jgi:hypothetical protein
MLRFALPASFVMAVIGMSGTAYATDEYYMLIGDSWELGKVIQDPDGAQEFVTCPGGERYKLDKSKLKATNDPCDGSSKRFVVIEKPWDAAAKQFTARMGNGELQTWTTTDPSQLQGLLPGTQLFLSPTQAGGNIADFYQFTKPDL